ncbi:MAG: DUF484 family protein [Pseudomonadota bacterium]
MSEAKTAVMPEPEDETVNESRIADHLRRNPDFLQRFPDLLETLELRHAAGTAVSLIERQVEILRGRSQRLEDRLKNLLDAARDNEKRATSVHTLARTLIRAPSLAAAMLGLRKSLREDFGIEEVFVGVGANFLKRQDIEGLARLDPNGPLVKGFDNFFRTGLIECGPLDEARAHLLFPQAKVLVHSAALVPLEKEKNLGMLALGSVDAGRFQPRQGRMFLEMTAELVSAALRAKLD